MEQVLYCSKAAGGGAGRDVFDIIEQSERNNPARRITGFLLSDSDRFLQFLEGPALAVEALLAQIGDDSRHTGMKVLLRRNSDERWFSQWAMKSLLSFRSGPAVDQIAHVAANYSGGDELLGAVTAFLGE